MSYLKNTLTLLFVFTLFNVHSQNNCEELKKIITVKNGEINKLHNEIIYYKNALNLTKSEIVGQIENIKFQVNSVVGSKQKKTIEVEGIFTNQGDILKALQAEKATIIDPQGNQYLGYDIIFGGVKGSARVENVHNNIPVKFRITFKDINDEIPMIRLLTLDIYSTINHIGTSLGKFENINIIWK